MTTANAGIGGIHHVTAIARDPQRNLEFYVGVLGLRLVKRTVNFDDPGTYHFYFGDEVGTPGSILTFFPWPRGHRGRQGPGQVAVTSFAIVPESVGFWIERMLRYGIPYQGPADPDIAGSEGERVISFKDPDGLLLELVASAGAEARPTWGNASGIPREYAIHGFHAVTLWVEQGDATIRLLIDTLGFRLLGEAGSVHRLSVGDGGPGSLVQVRTTGGFVQGVSGAGTVHHIAWRVPDDSTQLSFREQVRSAGLDPTPVIDRQYFRSVYFREPGGALYELATNSPGFLTDEPVERLGERLMLPPWYEPERARIQTALPPIHLPGPLSQDSFLPAGN